MGSWKVQIVNEEGKPVMTAELKNFSTNNRGTIRYKGIQIENLKIKPTIADMILDAVREELYYLEKDKEEL